jgi:predicted nucleic acid-binding protein
MNYLLDTSFIVDSVLRTRTPFRRAYPHLSNHLLALSVVSLAELYEGPFHGSNPAAATKALHAQLTHLAIVPLDEPICMQFGELRAQLRRQGKRVADLDLLIAATALERDLTLITKDMGDFEAIPGIRLANL